MDGIFCRFRNKCFVHLFSVRCIGCGVVALAVDDGRRGADYSLWMADGACFFHFCNAVIERFVVGDVYVIVLQLLIRSIVKRYL